jgi:hypothetical protein
MDQYVYIAKSQRYARKNLEKHLRQKSVDTSRVVNLFGVDTFFQPTQFLPICSSKHFIAYFRKSIFSALHSVNSEWDGIRSLGPVLPVNNLHPKDVQMFS